MSFKDIVITSPIKCNEIIEDHVGGIQADFLFSSQYLLFANAFQHDLFFSKREKKRHCDDCYTATFTHFKYLIFILKFSSFFQYYHILSFKKR